MTVAHRLPASFRDPSGFLFQRDGVLLRQVNRSYRGDYTRLVESGLHQALVDEGLLVAHEETEAQPADPALAYKVIRPSRLGFISYPYEWSFSQFKDAALATLAIQRRALEFGMSLKDASAYNIQFHRGRPLLVDTLSFEAYREGEPWVSYRQFCQHFLAPLALMAYRDVRLSRLLAAHIDGLPLDLAVRLLPWRTRASLPLLLHIHLHAASQRRYARRPVVRPDHRRAVTKIALLGLIDSLESPIRALRLGQRKTDWDGYYAENNYTPAAMEHKQALVSDFLDRVRPRGLWDLGANTGVFSRLASTRGIPTVAFDADHGAVELNYLKCVADGDQHLLPLLMDLTNPSPALGWRSQERASLLSRGPVDAVLALALIHHLAIANNVPLDSLAEFVHQLGEWALVEFVPKNDSQVQRLLAFREDVFPDYTREGFEQAFGRLFSICTVEPIRESERLIYVLKGRSPRR